MRTPTPTTNCSPPNWPALTAKSTPPTPNAAASSTPTRPALSSYPELQRRAADVEHRRRDLEQRRDALTAQRHQLTRDNQLRHRVRHFASRVLDVIDTLDFDQKQTLLRLVVEEVHVTGWHVQIRLRIPLDDNPDGPPPTAQPQPRSRPARPRVNRRPCRSLGTQEMGLPAPARSPTDRRCTGRAGRADGDGQPELGISQGAGRAAQARRTGSAPRRSGGSSNGTASRRPRFGTPTPRGGSSCAPRPPACLRSTSSTSTAR